MLRPSPLQPCRRADPCSPPFTALRNAHPRYAVSIRRAPPCWIGLGCPSLTDCGSFKRPLSGPFDGLTRSDLGRIEPLSLAWWCDRLRRLSPVVAQSGDRLLSETPSHHSALAAGTRLMPHLKQWRIDTPLIAQSRPPMTVTRLQGKFDRQLTRAAHRTFRPSDLTGECEARNAL